MKDTSGGEGLKSDSVNNNKEFLKVHTKFGDKQPFEGGGTKGLRLSTRAKGENH